MSSYEEISNPLHCDEYNQKLFLGALLSALRSAAKEIKDFNSSFKEFSEEQKKASKDLWNCVTRYNILNAGPPCVYPIIEKEDMLEEMLVEIQQKTNSIHNSLKIIKSKQKNLHELSKSLRKQSLSLNWDASMNPSIKGGINHLPPSQNLEDIADIIFQFDIAVSVMLQYFDALNLHNTASYEYLMNSISISSEVIELVKEFLIKNILILK